MLGANCTLCKFLINTTTLVRFVVVVFLLSGFDYTTANELRFHRIYDSMQFLTTIMSHHLSQDKAVKKLGMSENILLKILPSQVLFKSMKANFQP